MLGGGGGEAFHEEIEEGFCVGVEADVGVGGARLLAGVAFGVDGEVHGLHGADGGVEEPGDGHGIEEGGGELAPLGVEQGEVVGVGIACAEELGAFDLFELELGCVEREDVDGDAGGEEFVGGGDVVEDVPLRGGRLGGAVLGFAVAAADRAAHDDDLLEAAEEGWVTVDEGADVGEGADGEEGDLVRVARDLFREEVECGGMAGDGVMLFRVDFLGEAGGWWCGQTYRYRDVCVAGVREEAVEQAGAEGGIAEGGGEAEDPEFGAAQGEGDGEGVVDVVTDVGVDDDFCGGVWPGLCGCDLGCGDDGDDRGENGAGDFCSKGLQLCCRSPGEKGTPGRWAPSLRTCSDGAF